MSIFKGLKAISLVTEQVRLASTTCVSHHNETPRPLWATYSSIQTPPPPQEEFYVQVGSPVAQLC